MRRVLLRTIAVLAVGLGVLSGVLFVASTVDARPPEVSGYRLTQPLPGDPGRALITSGVEISFSEPVDRASADAALRIEPTVTGAISWSGSTMTFTPAQPLPLQTAFEVHVLAGVRDLAGNTMDEASAPFGFETAGRPQVDDSVPDAGAEEVALEASISLTFSTFMDTASVESALRLRPHFANRLRWSGERLEIIPSEPLRAGLRYEVRIDDAAADVAGVTLAAPYTLIFRTVAAGLEPAALVPADGTDGIAPTTPIAVIFDEPIEPDSVSSDLLSITPAITGTLELIALDGQDEPRILRFTPSSPLPPSTTFEIELAAGPLAVDGGRLAVPLRWSFTTGAPLATLGNQLVFLSARSGVANLWAMNPDGTNQRQLSAELSPVTDYAVAPDGRSFVVGDGRGLILQQSDGSGRRSLTDDGVLEFDPTFSPDGRSIALGRASARTGEGLGLWQRSADGGDARRIELPGELAVSPSPSATDGAEPAPVLRAPRYAPDGQALAFVDTSGRVGIVELPAERLTSVAFVALAPPVWLPDSSGVLVTGLPPPPGDARPARVDEPLQPLDPLGAGLDGEALEAVGIALFPRSGGAVEETTFGRGAARVSVDANGTVAFLRLSTGEDPPVGGRLYLADGPRRLPRSVAATTDLVVSAVAFAPEPDLVALALPGGGRLRQDGIWLLDLGTDELALLAEDGSWPRWLP